MEEQKKENSAKPMNQGKDSLTQGSKGTVSGLLSGTVFPGSKVEVFDKETANYHEVLISNIGKTPLHFYYSDPPGNDIPAGSWILQPGRSMAWRNGVDHGRCLYVLNPHKDRQGFFTVKLN